MPDNRKIYLATVSVFIALIVGLGGLLISFAQDRQDVAVALEHLAVSSQQQKSDITDIKATLRILADHNAAVSVLQHQVSDLQRQINRLEQK